MSQRLMCAAAAMLMAMTVLSGCVSTRNQEAPPLSESKEVESVPFSRAYWDYIELELDTKMPDFTVSTTDGEEFTLSEYDGRLCLFYFNSGCGKCGEVLRTFQQVSEEYADTCRFVFVEGSDPDTESTDAAEDYMKDNELHFKCYYNYGRSLTNAFAIKTSPVGILVEGGKVVDFIIEQNRMDRQLIEEDILAAFGNEDLNQ